MPSSDDAARVAELRRHVEHHNHRYHVLDDPELPDSAFDALFDELKALEEVHPELVVADSPTQRVGGAPAAGFTKVEHLQAMGSLEKVTTSEALEKWAADVRKRLGTDETVAYVDRTEDRRLCDLARLRERRLRPGCDPRRRLARRGRDPEPPHGGSRAARGCSRTTSEPPAAARGARRDLLPARRASRASTRRRSKRARSLRRTRATPPRARCGSSIPASQRRGRCRSGSTASARARGISRRRSGRCSPGFASTASARTRTRSGSSRSRRSRTRAARGRRAERSSTTRSTES